MPTKPIKIIKASGERADFSRHKLEESLGRSGASPDAVASILKTVENEIYPGITTKEIYNRAFLLLKKFKSIYASKYKLKRAIYELGPTGFPFERFIAALLTYSGYNTWVGQSMKGKCVNHEVDVLAKKGDEFIIAECKFHGEKGVVCNVKIPLYIDSRYRDIIANYKDEHQAPNQGWVVTNTRFTSDALNYGSCVGLYMLSWDYPAENAIKDRIDRLGLYPVTVSTLLSKKEKQFLLSRDIVLCRQLLNDSFYLDHLGISEKRKERIYKEIHQLCHPS